MVEKIYFVDVNAESLFEMLDLLVEKIPCFLETEFIEMNMMKVIINARVQDLRTVENFLAPFV